MEEFLTLFLTAVAIAVILNVILKKFGIPTIIGYIATGLFVREFYGFNTNENITHVAEFGIVFLMFTIGLEFSFKHLLAMKKEVFLNGSLQMLTCGLVCTLLVTYILGVTSHIAMIAGFALALSSTAIVLKILNDNGDINQEYGRKALGILLFQDIAVIPLLLMIDIFSSQNADISKLLLTTLVSAIILLVLLYFIGKYLFTYILKFIIKTNANEIFIATILFTVIGASFLAHSFGFSYSLGAFIAGALIAETKYKHKIEADLIPFRDLLLGFFFVSVGLQIDFRVVFENWFLICSFVVLVLLIKFVVIYGLLNLYTRKRVALKTALSISQIGEFALAVFSLMQVNSLIEAKTAQIFIIVSIITMIATPFILNNIRKIANVAEGEQDEMANFYLCDKKMKGHFIIFGYARLGQEVVQRVKKTGIPYLVLESDLNLVELGRSRNENVYFANVAQIQTLEIANIEECSVAIITISNEAKLDMLYQVLSNLKKPIQTVLKTSGSGSSIVFPHTDKNLHIINQEASLARNLVQEALQCRINTSTAE
ncbi:cation:proton antiporter [Campylobacter volucris]|uniref:cation:proton antiporter n=1 Tax=Campylobacter volucris TaxID=1031542 RepID=UPI00189EA36D|nr:cation:proton antiporter [Campylobacter volucris]MBF7049583.1 cation:proton antiporter [Campylobacter volucris]MBF7060698.1 cation:proton antiporter [Campylobacter volucris]